MTRDMILMYKFGSILCAQNNRLIMTFKTFSLRYMTVPLNHAEMAFLASHPSRDILLVIEVPAFDLNIPFRLDMAGGATPDGAGKAILFALWTGVIVVTDEAVDLVNGQVQALNKLSMAARAAELHPPSELAQMFSVRERHILIDHISLEVFGLMTSLLKAACVADLGMRCTRPLSRQEVSQRHLPVHPFPLEMVQKPGLIMAFRAGHMPVTGGSPRFHVDVHLVTEAAEGRALRKFEKTD